MRAVRRRDTRPELAIRRILHRRGFRYRVDLAPLPGLRRRADIVFTAARVAVFVDGCFWHGCPLHGTVPKVNQDYWVSKIAANQRRDADTDERLEAMGWFVIRIWAHEEPSTAADRIASAVIRRRH